MRFLTNTAIGGCLLIGMLAEAPPALGSEPDWWQSSGAMASLASAEDGAALNLAQLKEFASKVVQKFATGILRSANGGNLPATAVS
jgi:hypothetical protein